MLSSRTFRQEADEDQVPIWLKNEDFKAPFLATFEPLNIYYVLKVETLTLTTDTVA